MSIPDEIAKHERLRVKRQRQREGQRIRKRMSKWKKQFPDLKPLYTDLIHRVDYGDCFPQTNDICKELNFIMRMKNKFHEMKGKPYDMISDGFEWRSYYQRYLFLRGTPLRGKIPLDHPIWRLLNNDFDLSNIYFINVIAPYAWSIVHCHK